MQHDLVDGLARKSSSNPQSPYAFAISLSAIVATVIEFMIKRPKLNLPALPSPLGLQRSGNDEILLTPSLITASV